jgi:hypothetical protein
MDFEGLNMYISKIRNFRFQLALILSKSIGSMVKKLCISISSSYFAWYWNGDNYKMSNIIGFTLNPIHLEYYMKDERGV